MDGGHFDDLEPADDSAAMLQFKRMLDDLLEELHLTDTDAAAKINISRERMKKYKNPDVPNSLPAYLIPIWTVRIGPQLPMILMHDANHTIASLPQLPANCHDATRIGAKGMEDFADVLAKFAQCAQEGYMTVRQYQGVKQAIQDAMSALLAIQLLSMRMVKVLLPHD